MTLSAKSDSHPAATIISGMVNVRNPVCLDHLSRAPKITTYSKVEERVITLDRDTD